MAVKSNKRTVKKKTEDINIVSNERDKLLKEIQQREAELAIISSVGEAMSKQLNVQTVTRIVGDKVRSIFDSEVTEILLLDTKTNIVNVPYSFYRDYVNVEPFPLGEGITSKVINSGKPLVCGTLKEQIKAGAIFDEAVGKDDDTESYMGVPISIGGKVLGVVSVQSYKKNAYTENNVRLLSTLSVNMVFALENARLFEETKILLLETQQRNAELGVINSVQEGLVAHMDIQEIYELVGEKIKEIFDAQVVSIGKYDHKKKMCEFKYDIEKGERFYDKPRKFNAIDQLIIKTKKRFVISEDFVNTLVKIGLKKPKQSEGTEMPKSAIWVPLIVGKIVTGHVSLQNVDRENAFGESEIQLLSTLANSLSIALINAELFEETKSLLNKTEQRNAELGVINSVQEGLVEQMDIQAIYDLVGEKIREIFDAQVVSIGKYDSKNKLCEFKYDIEKGERFYDKPRKFNAIDKHIIKTKKRLVINQDFVNNFIKLGEKKPKAAEGTDMAKSAVWVPLQVGRIVTGHISLQNVDRENAFGESEIQLLSTLANSLSIALNNAELFESTRVLLDESEQRNSELGVINSVQEGLVAQMDLQAIYDLVGNQIRDMFDAQVVGIASFDHDKGLELFNYVIEKGERFFPEHRTLDNLRKHLIKSRNLILINENYEKAAAKFGMHVLKGTESPKSLLFVPLIVGEKVNGYITLQNIDRENAFSDSDVRLLTTLANSMSVALENARLFDETKQQAIELKIINSVGEGLARKLDFQSIIDLVGDKIREVFNAQIVSISTYNKDKDQIHHRYAVELDEKYHFDKPQDIDSDRKEILISKKPLIFGTSQEIIDHSGEHVVAGEMPESFMGVPIILNQESTGVITVQDLDKQHLFEERDVRLLMTLASNMGVALENARLFEETTRLLDETQQRNTELSILNAIQEGLVMEMDFEAIINLVGDKLREAMGFLDLGIRLYDKENDILKFPYEFEHGKRLYIEDMPPTVISRYVLNTGKLLLIKENSQEAIKNLGLEGMTLIPGTDQSKSVIAVPIMLGTEAKGLILIENYERYDAFSDSDIRLLSTLANSMSVALENARLFDETMRLYKESEERASELATVNRISQAIVGHLKIDKLIEMIGDNARELFNANIAYVALLNKDTNIIEFPYGYGDEFPPLKYGEGLTSKIIETGEPLLLNTEVDEKTEELGVTRIGEKAASYLGVPIPIGTEIMGVLSVQSTEEENKFTGDDMRMLNTIAAHVGIAINNANAYQELNTTLHNLKDTQDQLVAQEKLASLGQLTAGIAHEIKNPLNFVNNFSELSASMVDELIENLESQKDVIKEDILEDSKEILDTLKLNSQKIIEHGKRADSIVHSMLQHSRGKTSEKQITDINSMLEEDLNLVYHGLRAQDSTFNISIKKEYDENLEKINVVPQDVSRAFLNILTNGCYEAHKKKTEHNKDEPATIFVKSVNSNDHIEVRIRDNGSGIPKKIQDELFKPFFTTKPAGKGTGLGLSISYDIIVQEHQGELFFDTKENEFTEFIIRLPKTN